MIARTIPVEPFDLVVFGATGDLARRKLLPAIYRRMRAGQIPPGARVIGAARRSFDDAAFRELVSAALVEFVDPAERNAKDIERFLGCIEYVRVDIADASAPCWPSLAARLGAGAAKLRAFYLAVSPEYFAPISTRLNECGAGGPGARVVIEKPLGHDGASARALNRALGSHFRESQLFRIDHYLGKETVQNLMVLRFANALFEPIWNAHYVDHVQITVAESLGIGSRAGYFDAIGTLRDMVQNHLLQLLCLIAMEPPHRYEADAVRDEKLKVVRSLEPMEGDRVAHEAIRGQYLAGRETRAYLDEVGDPDSRTETFVALKARIANWRWSGTPFYLRTGKRLRSRVSEIAVAFKDTPHSLFPVRAGTSRGNVLVIRLQPDEGITLSMTIKEPGPGGLRLLEVPLDMSFADSLGVGAGVLPDAYERLLMDVIRGDQTLFMRGDEVEAAWDWIDPIVNAWGESSSAPIAYEPGGSGPEEALALMHRDARRWRAIGG